VDFEYFNPTNLESREDHFICFLYHFATLEANLHIFVRREHYIM
jgi:hypothetical protein